MKRFLQSLTILLASGGLSYAQTPSLPLASTSGAPAPAQPVVPLNNSTAPSDSQAWVSADYLLWWIKGSQLPPLLITSGSTPLTQTTTPFPFLLPAASIVTDSSSPSPPSFSSVLVGPGFGDEIRSGCRCSIGSWLDSEQTFGVEAGYFILPSQSSHVSAASSGNPGLAIPFVNAATGQPGSYAIGQSASVTSFSSVFITGGGINVFLGNTIITDAASGAVSFASSSQLQGTEANAILRAVNGSGFSLDLLAGFRYVQLDDSLSIGSTVTQTHTNTTTNDTVLGSGTIVDNFTALVTRSDQFQAHNDFFGGQLGARAAYTWGNFSLSACGEVALGNMNQTVNVSGATAASITRLTTPTFAIPGTPFLFPIGPPVTTHAVQQSVGGLFAQTTNIGNHSRDVLAVVPEGTLKVGYDITPRIRVSLGYSIFYMNDVVRAGEQIDRGINPGLLAYPPVLGSPARPAFQFNTTDFWAQGLDLGLAFRF
jgi:Putative beta barrel porin-7 (BBP7)